MARIRLAFLSVVLLALILAAPADAFIGSHGRELTKDAIKSAGDRGDGNGMRAVGSDRPVDNDEALSERMTPFLALGDSVGSAHRETFNRTLEEAGVEPATEESPYLDGRNDRVVYFSILDGEEVSGVLPWSSNVRTRPPAADYDYGPPNSNSHRNLNSNSNLPDPRLNNNPPNNMLNIRVPDHLPLLRSD